MSYTPNDLARAGQDLARLPPDSELRVMMMDYKATRDQIRACRGTLGRPW